MSDIYVFGPDEENNDYSTLGLVGALTPTSAVFSETINGESTLELAHPLDEFGRYQALQRGNILVASVPVRTTPEIQNGSCVTTVWTYKVKDLNILTHKNQRTLFKKAKGSGRKKIMNPGDTMTVVSKPEDASARWKVKTKYGTGYVMPDGVELVTEHKISDNSEAIEEIESPWKVSPQYFRIFEVKKELDGVTVTARHISYDLLYNMTRCYREDALTLPDALNAVLNDTYSPHPFSAHTNVSNEQTGLFYRNRNPIDAILDPEEGICKKFGVGLVRDNYELYFLKDPGVNRGVRIEYKKNMLGVEYTDSDDEVATRIIPTGENKDGSVLYLADNNDGNAQCVDSPLIGNYSVPHLYVLKCDNCKVGDKDTGGGKVTVAIARQRMRKQAQELLYGGCDQPKVSMSVKFVNLGDTEEYSAYRELENCFLFDYLIVQNGRLGIDVTAQIASIRWNVLLDRMESVDIGTIGKTLANTGITTWQIPSGFSGSKIAGGTVGSGALQSDIISARHMQAESINTDALQALCVTAVKIAAGAITSDKIEANSITAEKIEAGSVTAEKIQAGAITSEKIDAGSVTADKIQAGAITADKLDAKTVDARVADIFLANLNTANIQQANIDWAQILTLTAEIANISRAQINTANIAEANIDWAKIENLSAMVAEIAQAKIESADIEWARIEELKALMAEIAEAEIGKATITDAQIDAAGIDFAKIRDLAAGTAIITEGVGGQLFISRLAVTEANMVSLSVGELLVKGDDGGFYAVRVNDAGDIVTERKQVGNSDVLDASINGGEKIIEGSITAATLNATDIFANNAVIAQLIAANIDVGTLFAREATIHALNTMDITGNEYLKLVVDRMDDRLSKAELRLTDDAIIQTVTSSSAYQKDIDRRIGYRLEILSTSDVLSSDIKTTILSARVMRGNENVTDEIPDERFAWRQISRDSAADEIWDANHRGMKSVIVAVKDVLSSATYFCDLLDE